MEESAGSNSNGHFVDKCNGEENRHAWEWNLFRRFKGFKDVLNVEELECQDDHRTNQSNSVIVLDDVEEKSVVQNLVATE